MGKVRQGHLASHWITYIGTKIAPVNRGWFTPKRFVSVFLKPYGQRLITQEAIGGLSNYFFGSVLGYLEKQQDNPDYDWYWSYIND